MQYNCMVGLAAFLLGNGEGADECRRLIVEHELTHHRSKANDCIALITQAMKRFPKSAKVQQAGIIVFTNLCTGSGERSNEMRLSLLEEGAHVLALAAIKYFDKKDNEHTDLVLQFGVAFLQNLCAGEGGHRPRQLLMSTHHVNILPRLEAILKRYTSMVVQGHGIGLLGNLCVGWDDDEGDSDEFPGAETRRDMIVDLEGHQWIAGVMRAFKTESAIQKVCFRAIINLCEGGGPASDQRREECFGARLHVLTCEALSSALLAVDSEMSDLGKLALGMMMYDSGRRRERDTAIRLTMQDYDIRFNIGSCVCLGQRNRREFQPFAADPNFVRDFGADEDFEDEGLQRALQHRESIVEVESDNGSEASDEADRQHRRSRSLDRGADEADPDGYESRAEGDRGQGGGGGGGGGLLSQLFLRKPSLTERESSQESAGRQISFRSQRSTSSRRSSGDDEDRKGSEERIRRKTSRDRGLSSFMAGSFRRGDEDEDAADGDGGVQRSRASSQRQSSVRTSFMKRTVSHLRRSKEERQTQPGSPIPTPSRNKKERSQSSGRESSFFGQSFTRSGSSAQDQAGSSSMSDLDEPLLPSSPSPTGRKSPKKKGKQRSTSGSRLASQSSFESTDSAAAGGSGGGKKKVKKKKRSSQEGSSQLPSPPSFTSERSAAQDGTKTKKKKKKKKKDKDRRSRKDSSASIIRRGEPADSAAEQTEEEDFFAAEFSPLLSPPHGASGDEGSGGSGEGRATAVADDDKPAARRSKRAGRAKKIDVI